MIVATFNGLDLLLVALVIGVSFWLLMEGARRMDDFEDRLMAEWRDARIRRQLDAPVLYDQERDGWDSTLADISDLPEAS